MFIIVLFVSGRGKVKNNLDFLSEIYNTAFSKLPKVLIRLISP